MRRINYPIFPIPPYAGDASNPPIRPNSGIGMREYSALVILHSLIIACPQFGDDELCETAIAQADLLVELLAQK
jgi:hypothetical protein